MRQWHQGKEGFMKVTRIQDKYNPDKVWIHVVSAHYSSEEAEESTE